jgi:hypothetical protein
MQAKTGTGRSMTFGAAKQAPAQIVGAALRAVIRWLRLRIIAIT